MIAAILLSIAPHVLSPEIPASVSHGEIFGVPLYDGEIVRNPEWTKAFTYLRTIEEARPLEFETRFGYSATSRRVAPFRANGAPGSGATILVRLRLPNLHERCDSCRIVHFIVRVT